MGIPVGYQDGVWIESNINGKLKVVKELQVDYYKPDMVGKQVIIEGTDNHCILVNIVKKSTVGNVYTILKRNFGSKILVVGSRNKAKTLTKEEIQEAIISESVNNLKLLKEGNKYHVDIEGFSDIEVSFDTNVVCVKVPKPLGKVVDVGVQSCCLDNVMCSDEAIETVDPIMEKTVEHSESTGADIGGKVDIQPEKVEPSEVENDEPEVGNCSTKETMDTTLEINDKASMYEYILGESEKWDRFSVPKSILTGFKYETLKIIESNYEVNKRTEISKVRLPKSGLVVTVLALIDPEKVNVKLQVMGVSEACGIEDVEDIELDYYKWRNNKKYL